MQRKFSIHLGNHICHTECSCNKNDYNCNSNNKYKRSSIASTFLQPHRPCTMYKACSTQAAASSDYSNVTPALKGKLRHVLKSAYTVGTNLAAQSVNA
eukprot:2023307-Amphidinium_carterae.1